MDELYLCKEFNQAFNLLIEGDLSVIALENDETKELLSLAGQILEIDYSGDSKIRKTLKNKLLIKINEQKQQGELNDADLDYAAGGLTDFWEENHSEKNKKL